MKAITENQLHDFVINSRHSCKKYWLHSCTFWEITITVDRRIKFRLRKGDCSWKRCFFSRVSLRWPWNLFSSIRLISFIDPLYQKASKILMLEVAKVLNLTLLSVRSLKSLTRLSPKFFWGPQFFSIFWQQVVKEVYCQNLREILM